MSGKQRRRRGSGRIDEEQVQVLVARARADIAAVLDQVLDDEAGLAAVYAHHGLMAPALAPAPEPEDPGGAVQAVCERIAMLETALAPAGQPGGIPGQAGFYLAAARRYLAELRFGLASRDLAAGNASRLLNTIRHDLLQASQSLHHDQQLPLSPPVLARMGDLEELTGDLTRQLNDLTGPVMRLFGRSPDPALVPVS